MVRGSHRERRSLLALVLLVVRFTMTSLRVVALDRSSMEIPPVPRRMLLTLKQRSRTRNAQRRA